jgi:hypothetical protein
MKTIKIEELKHGVKEMQSMPIGHRFSIINGRTKEGIEKCTEWTKISDTHVSGRNYNYS